MAKQNGFIALHRQILNWEWYRHPNTAFLFIHLLLSANFTDGVFKGMPVKRGQLVTSLTDLSTGTGLSYQQARTALAHLRSTGEITDDANNQYRVITVVKYDDYQMSTGNLTGKQQAMRKNLTGNQQANQQANQQQYNNINNITNEQSNNKTIISSSDDSAFDVFWFEYPRKVDKQVALRAWKKLKPDKELTEAIMNGLEKWKSSDQWLKEDGQYIPYPATWLNKRRWEDPPEKREKPAPVPAKQVVAQQYEQRDYHDDMEEIMRQQNERIIARLRAEGRTDV